MNKMKKVYKSGRNIRGVRSFVELFKTVPNIPGFAPDEFERKVGDVVVDYREFAPYFQPDDDCPTLEAQEIQDILELLSTPFDALEFGHKVAEAKKTLSK